MLCYKDKTWCVASTCCNWDSCDRAYTDKRTEENMTTVNMLVSVFISPPQNCFNIKLEENAND